MGWTMIRPVDLGATVAAAVVVLTAVLGGGFYPLPRLLVGVALIVVWAIAAAGSSGRMDQIEIGQIAFVAWGVVSAVLVGASPLASKEVLAIWITACLLHGICRRGGEKGRRNALGVLLVGAVMVASAVVGEALVYGIRVGGFFENPNLAAALLVPTLPVAWLILERTPKWRWTWMVVVTAGIILTGSRAGLLATVVAVGFLLAPGRWRFVGLGAGSVLALGVLAWRFISQPDVLAWHRVSIWWAVLKIWLTRPLTGVGPGCLVEAAGTERILHAEEVGRYQFVVGYAESTPLAILVQLGLLGVVLACLVVGTWFLGAHRSQVLRSRPVVASLAAIVVLSLFHDFLTLDLVLWWWAVLVGCIGARAQLSIDAPPLERTNSLRWSAAVVMVWLTAWGILTPAFARWTWHADEPTTPHVIRTLRIEPWLSTAPAGRVRRLMDDPDQWGWQEAAEALHWARTAVNAHPGLARLWADLGNVHLRILTDLGGTEHDVEAARATLTRACELDPRLPWHWLERARLERVSGNLELAIRWTRHALEQEPNTIRGWLFLSRLELELGRMGAARDALTEAERLSRLDRSNLNDYELELVLVLPDQLELLQSALATKEKP